MARASATRCAWPPESCVGPARGEVVELDEAERLVSQRLRVGDAAALEPERHVGEHRHVREQRVALEHRVDGALVGLARRDVLAADQDAAGRGLLEPRDESQRRGLAAAGRAEQGEERPGGDREVEVLDRREPGEPLRDADQFEVGPRLVERSGHQAPIRTDWNSAP